MAKKLGGISPELRLMLACASGDTAKSRELLAQVSDWSLFVRMAVHHRVYPLVYKTLQQLDDPIAPEGIMATLRTECRENTLRALRISRTALQLIDVLHNSNIRAVILKGPALAQRLYGEVTLRPCKDIDLLVCPEDLEPTDCLLAQQGYRRIHPDFPLTAALRQFYLRKYHHFDYWHHEHKVEVEVHWQLRHRDLELPLSITEKRSTLALAGQAVPVLHDEEWFLFLVLHGVSHGWFRLRWLCDIGEFLQQSAMDWEHITRMADSAKIRPLLHQTLILVQQLLGVAGPKPVCSAWATDEEAWRLAQLTVAFFANAQDEPWDENRGRHWRLFWRTKQYDWQVRRSWRNKLHYVWNMFSPSEADVETLLLPPAAYPLYYLLRPFRWLWRRV